MCSIVQALPVGVDWHWAQPIGGGNRIESIAYNGTKFVAVGYGGLIRVSSDGFSWTDESLTSISQISDHKIIWAGGQFVYVGDNGRISTSPDAASFFPRTSNTSENLNDIVYDGSQYVAVGDNSTIVTSNDGINWTVITGPTAMGAIQGIDWNGSFFVTVSSNGNIFTSPDAVSWAQEPTPALFQLHDVIWNGSQWLAVGLPAVVFTSPDGVNWTQQSAPPGIINIHRVTWDGTQYLAVGDDGYIVKSSDGTSWLQVTQLGVGQGGGFYDIIALSTSISSGKYFVVGTGGHITSSLNLGQWNGRIPKGIINIDRYDAVAYSGSLFVATGELTDVVTSTDGINWTIGSTNRYVDILWDGSKFVAVGADGRVGVSTDGVTWSEITIPAAALISIGQTHDGQLIATGFSGQLFISSDAVNWVSETSGTSNQLTSATSNGTISVVVGVDTILTSSDTINWTSQSLPGAGFFPLTKVIYANGQFVAVGSQGVVLTSPDGMTWSQSSVNVNWWSRGVNWTGFQYIAAGDSGNIMTSSDGFSWQQQRSNTDNDLMDIAGDDKIQVAVGQFGSLLYSQAFNEQPEPTASPLITDEDTVGNVSVSANDPDFGDSFTYAVTTMPGSGSASIDSNGLVSYTPNTNFNGIDSLVVTVTDAGGLTGTVTLAVTVNSVNDAPVPTAGTLITDEDSSGTISIMANDPDSGDSFTYAVTTPAGMGTATVDSNGLASYTPDANVNGSDSFEVTVTDAAGLSGTVTVSVTINPINDAPTATAPAISVTAGGSSASQITVTDIDMGDTFSYAISTAATKGTATVSTTGLVNYTANSASSGNDSLTVTVTDAAGASVDVTISVSIRAVSSGGSGSGGGGGSLSIWLLVMLYLSRKLTKS